MTEITIRHSELSDARQIKDIYQQKSCFGGTLQLPFPAEEKWQKRLGNWRDSDNDFSLVAEIDGMIVGQAGMHVYAAPRRKHVANMGMAVSEAHQGHGVGSQLLDALLDLALNWLAVKRVELEVYTDNPAAIALYKKHGFVIEGTMKDYAFRDGQYVDAHLMALLR